MCQFSPFCYPKVKENKMKPWKRHVWTTHTVCKHCWLIRYETDMGPELSTAATDQNFAWICKQHQDLTGSVLIFRTKIIWSGPEFGLVRCGYLNAAIYISRFGTGSNSIRPWSLHMSRSYFSPDQTFGTERYRLHNQTWSRPWSDKDLVRTQLVL